MHVQSYKEKHQINMLNVLLNVLKTLTLWPLFMDGLQLPQG